MWPQCFGSASFFCSIWMSFIFTTFFWAYKTMSLEVKRHNTITLQSRPWLFGNIIMWFAIHRFYSIAIFFWQDEWIYAGVGSTVLSSLILLKYWLRSFLPKMLQLDIKFVSPFVTNDSCSCRYWLQITHKLQLIFILTWKISEYPIKSCISSEDWKYVSS